jgi:hypothetical protein
MKSGHWSRNKYYRLNVKDFVEEFCGWRNLQELIKHAGDLRNETFLATLFLTGGRVSEVLALKTENFVERRPEGVMIVRGMLLEKRYKKIKETVDAAGHKHWITEKIVAKRKQFPIVIAEPLTPTLLEWLRQSQDLLFPSPYKVDLPLSRGWAYKLVRTVETRIPGTLRDALGLNRPFVVNGVKVNDSIHLWLHWFRSQRASQLVRDYNFEVIDLLNYFSWEKYETALNYAKRGWRDLSAKMKLSPAVYT